MRLGVDSLRESAENPRFNWSEIGVTLQKQGFWFVDVPRTSSTSLRVELHEKFGPINGLVNLPRTAEALTEMPVPGHSTAALMAEKVGPDIWSRILTFSIVRNPWDRILSLYHYRKIAGNLPEPWGFEEYVQRLEHADQTTPGFTHHAFRLGAVDYLKGQDGEILVNKVLRFEDRAAGLREIGKRLGTSELGSAWFHKATPAQLDRHNAYSEKTKAIIAKLYAEDIKLFDYSFAPDE